VGLENGVLSADDNGVPNYVLLEDKMHRIVAPSIGNKNAYSIIFWTMSDEKDRSPSPQKIVSNNLLTGIVLTWHAKFGGVIYGASEFSSLFSEVNEYTRYETRTAESMAV